MAPYARPVLCRLCAFPAPDGGVPVCEVDRGKLSEWCLRMMDTELDQEGLDEAVVCQFCVSDARFEHENGDESSERLQWWSNTEEKSQERFYSAGLIKPCAVKILNLTSTGISFKKQRWPSIKNKYSCDFCQQNFSGKILLFNHIKTLHRETTFFPCHNCLIVFKTKEERTEHCLQTHKDWVTCIYCNAGTFDHYSTYKDHMKLKHKSEAIQCRGYNCAMFFKTTQERESHMQEKHSKQTQSECIFCKKMVSILNMKNHVRTKHRSEAIYCKFNTKCSDFFKTETERELHVLKVHLDGVKERSRCIYCLNVFSRDGMRSHISGVHKDVAIKCTFHSHCNIYFHTEEQRLQHVKEVHETGPNKVKCVYCQKMIDNFSLGQHMKSNHRSVNIIRCDYNQNCLTYFLTDEEKQKHILEKHESGENKVKCIYCEKMVSNISLRSHSLTNHKSVLIKCNFHGYCATYFHTEEQRKEHIIQVHKTGPSREETKCIYCGKIYPDFLATHDHVNDIHADIKIKCTLRGCQSYFFTQEERQQHFQQVHQQDEELKVYQCQECNFKTKEKRSLNRHHGVKHGTERLQCPQCPVIPGKWHRSQYALKRHCKDTHRDTVVCRHCLEPKTMIKSHTQKSTCKFCKEVLLCKGLHLQHLKQKHYKYKGYVKKAKANSND